MLVNKKFCNLQTDIGELELKFYHEAECDIDFCDICLLPNECRSNVYFGIDSDRKNDLLVFSTNPLFPNPFWASEDPIALSTLGLVSAYEVLECERIVREALKWIEYWTTVTD